MKEKFITDLISQIAESRAKIIDDFIKTYIASRADWFKEKPERLRRLVLMEEQSADMLTRRYWIEIKRGKLANSHKQK